MGRYSGRGEMEEGSDRELGWEGDLKWSTCKGKGRKGKRNVGLDMERYS